MQRLTFLRENPSVLSFECGAFSAFVLSLFIGISFGWLVCRILTYCVRLVIHDVDKIIVPLLVAVTIFIAQMYPFEIEKHFVSNIDKLSFELGFIYVFRQFGLCTSGYVIGVGITTLVDAYRSEE